MAMAWYRTDLYHRVLSYLMALGKFLYQQWPHNPETPHGAWNPYFQQSGSHCSIWTHVSDRDNLNAPDNYHYWVLANGNMARCWLPKAILTSLFLRKTPDTATAA
jgi:hypothetical protein